MYLASKRFADICIAVISLILFSPLLLLTAICIAFTSKGPILYWSDRVGRGQRIFSMPKFRTMELDTPSVATHLLDNAENYLTPIGKFLRSTSLDELPQLWSVVIGDMSLVGPRPALYNQYDLIESRAELFVDSIRPGITGWAQINGRDELSIARKIELDFEYLRNMSLRFDLKIVFLTVLIVIRKDSITH